MNELNNIIYDLLCDLWLFVCNSVMFTNYYDFNTLYILYLKKWLMVVYIHVLYSYLTYLLVVIQHQVNNSFFKNFSFFIKNFIKTKTWAKFFFQLHFFKLYIQNKSNICFQYKYFLFYRSIQNKNKSNIFFSYIFYFIFKTITSLKSIQNVNQVGKKMNILDLDYQW